MPPVHVVPAPVSLDERSGDPFTLAAGVRIGGDRDAAGALRDLLIARAGLEPVVAEDAEAAITLRHEPGGAPESYRLEVSRDAVAITAPDAAGLFYGAQTLAQLVTQTGDGWVLPAVVIEDAPRFTYRGVMLDVARHFFDVATVTRFIDRIATLKFNVLHLHLSDDQGWRLQLASRPRLTEVASASAVGGDTGGFYTRGDYQQIVAHAASRHITVVPEFDVPGHTHAIGLAHPELVHPVMSDRLQDEAHGVPVDGEPYTGIGVGFSSLRTDDEAVYDFVADVFGELAALTPGPYLHFGGDESLATDAEGYRTFVSRVSQLIADRGKTPMAWHEAGSAGADLNDETVGQYWGLTTPDEAAADKARAIVANGGKLVLSPADAIYLDMKPDASSPLGLVWANGPTSLERAYRWEPASLLDGVAEEDILGVEAALWTETVRTPADIDALVFPRVAAAAEAAWSPATGPDRTWESFRDRVDGLAPLWRALGIGAER